MRGKIMQIIRACKLSEPILRYILMNGRVVSRASMRIKRGVRISEGQIIRAILYCLKFEFPTNISSFQDLEELQTCLLQLKRINTSRNLNKNYIVVFLHLASPKHLCAKEKHYDNS